MSRAKATLDQPSSDSPLQRAPEGNDVRHSFHSGRQIGIAQFEVTALHPNAERPDIYVNRRSYFRQ